MKVKQDYKSNTLAVSSDDRVESYDLFGIANLLFWAVIVGLMFGFAILDEPFVTCYKHIIEGFNNGA